MPRNPKIDMDFSGLTAQKSEGVPGIKRPRGENPFTPLVQKSWSDGCALYVDIPVPEGYSATDVGDTARARVRTAANKLDMGVKTNYEISEDEKTVRLHFQAGAKRAKKSGKSEDDTPTESVNDTPSDTPVKGRRSRAA